MQYAIVEGKVLKSLAEFSDNSFDAILTDPPYGLGSRQPTPEEIAAYLKGGELSTGGDFMGKAWNVPSVATWKELFRVLKPGGAVLCAGGPRVFDLVTIGMRMAGFEIRDSLAWMYGKGFPKSLNVSKAIDAAEGNERPVIGINEDYLRRKPNGMKTDGATAYGYSKIDQPTDARITAPGCKLSEQWDGYGTALKPGWEPIILARKPLQGTVVENVKAFGCGALNIDGCRLGGSKPFGGGAGHHPLVRMTHTGRWPANVALDEEAGALLDAHTGSKPSTYTGRKDPSKKHEYTAHAGSPGKVFEGHAGQSAVYADSGGASRFFYSAKVSTKERERGCELLPAKSAGERTGGARNHHPTLKPISLCTWLATLIKPPTDDACLLVPYSGAGSEVIGALQAGWPMVIGIEMDASYVQIAHARIASWCSSAIKV